MGGLVPPKSTSLALLTDLYQLTMAYGYWKLGIADRHAAFHLFFRSAPFKGGYAVAAGLGPALEFLETFRFDATDLEYLATLTGNDGRPLFEPGFLQYLGALRLSCDVEAMREGTVVFALEPLLRVRGPILQCQLLETTLLNLLNFQTLVATKAARICLAARGEPVIEFGLRRAQGIDGGLAASRAAYIGGCAGTSNMLAGKHFGIPVRGTHAHSWVMAFDSEQEAFDGYARVLPNNCVFLVDTYDTLDGVRNAIRTGQQLRASGHKMVGIRLDSGDLAYLSIEARKLLDEAGFQDAVILASNDLDERIIESLKVQGARIAVWGVGTKLVTAYDQPALGGVYKLGAVREDDGSWRPKMKVSEQAVKSTIPGTLQVRRYRSSAGPIADMIYDDLLGIDPRLRIVDVRDPMRQRAMADSTDSEDLLAPVVRGGQLVHEPEPLGVIRDRAREQLESFHPTIRRLLNPHEYPVGLDVALHERRVAMIRSLRESPPATGVD